LIRFKPKYKEVASMNKPRPTEEEVFEVPSPMEVIDVPPKEVLQGSEGKSVRLEMKYGAGTLQGMVTVVGETHVELLDRSVSEFVEYNNIDRVIFTE
jgi:hypothetical protein